MNEAIFSSASLCAMAAWVALAIAAALPAGAARGRLLFVAGRASPIVLCVLYALLLFRHWGSSPDGGFANLAAVGRLFAAPGKMLGGWVHFLAFDLLVGRWMVDDSLLPGRSRWLLALALPATFMYGPMGVLVYLGLRAVSRRSQGMAT